MKAIVLSAGYATRLYPLTKDTPKGLLPIGNKSILDFITDQIETVPEIDEIFIISNHKFFPNFSEWAKVRKTHLKITVLDDGTTDDSNKLGAIGDIWFTIQNGNIDEDVLIVAGDNFFTFPLNDYLEFYRKKQCDTILVSELDRLEDLRRMGNAILDAEDKVIGMEEKPQEPKSNCAVFASYIYKQETLPLIKQYLEEGNNPDAPGFFPSWLYQRKPIYAYKFVGECYDIGTHESYREVCEKFGNS
ncbi:MAG: nucleotidyltransferase family protein [Clostridia bacterium]|nr:nucleotidyltransferase family protein [Clostridia bacterium]